MRSGLVRFVELTVIGLVFYLLAGSGCVVAAAANLSRSYQSSASVTAGSLVSLATSPSGFVVPASSTNAGHLIGVAVASNDSLLAVDETPGRVQVALGGVANTLVSSLNGPINIGDSVAVSAIDGVGMKAAPGSKLIGIAQRALNNQSNNITTRQVTDKAGHNHQITIGYIPVAIAIGVAPSPGGTVHSIVGSAQNLAADIVGHPVSVLSIVVSGVIALLALVAVIGLVYGSIHSSILSIGRNPLAKPAVFEALAQVMAMAALIAAAAILIIYLLLR
ncbi:MAG: hypothetical protein ACREGF_02290 [Candidatus Saccharimonadales bacterium]